VVKKTAIRLMTAEARKEIDSPSMTGLRVKKPHVSLTATFKGYNDMTKHFLPGLTKAQADALDRSG
jgi:hypothetical protein